MVDLTGKEMCHHFTRRTRAARLSTWGAGRDGRTQPPTWREPLYMLLEIVAATSHSLPPPNPA